VTSKGQITLPKRVRDRLNLGPGDKVSVELGAGGAIVKLVPRPSESMLGVGKLAKKRLGGLGAADLLDELRSEDGEEL
jgi:AbrB family looped-hinge helix DNA binding protein